MLRLDPAHPRRHHFAAEPLHKLRARRRETSADENALDERLRGLAFSRCLALALRFSWQYGERVAAAYDRRHCSILLHAHD